MAKIKIPLILQWIAHSFKTNLKYANTLDQLKKVQDDVRELPEYQRQVDFLKDNKIDKPYDCFQCRSFDIEIDVCSTPYAYLYCGDKRRDRMCPGFDPPEQGKFELVVKSIENLV